jgi:hypothetical protein
MFALHVVLCGLTTPVERLAAVINQPTALATIAVDSQSVRCAKRKQVIQGNSKTAGGPGNINTAGGP